MEKLINIDNKYILFLLIGIFFTSCKNDFLNITPKGNINENLLENYLGAKQLLNGAYNLLNETGAAGGGYSASRNRLGTIASDEAYLGTTGTGNIENYSYTPEDGKFNAAWIFNYNAIQRVNDVIRILDKAEEIPKEEALQLRAEARFLRGLYHLRLIQVFGNIPYVDETVSYENGNYFVSNESSAWPKIEEDFKYAAKNLKPVKSEIGRANKWAAKAYLVKTYMCELKFSEAKPLLDDIIANGVTAGGDKYDLYEQYHWCFSYEHANGPGSVFAIQPSLRPSLNLCGNGGSIGNGPYGGSASAWGWTQPSFDFVNRFQTDPATGLPLINSYWKTPIKSDMGIPSSEPFTPYQGTLDPRLDWSVTRRGIPLLDRGVNPGIAWIRNPSQGGGPYSTMKHITWARNPQNNVGQRTMYPRKLIRFAQVLLWAAEVEVEIGSLSKAEKYVNRIRKRAANPDGFLKKYLDPDNPMGGFSDEPAANYFIGLYPEGYFEAKGQDWAREAVRFEEILELGLEHHRYFALQRYDKMQPGYMVNTLNAFLDRSRQSLPQKNNLKGAKFTQGKNEIYPIPQRQIDLSVDPETGEPTLKQNPGYK